MSEWSSECQAANRIAAQLRGQTYKRAKAKPVVIKRERATAVVREGIRLVNAEQVYAFMVEFFAENDQLPSVLHVCARMQISRTSAHGHMLKLVRNGYIEKNSVGRYRFVREVLQ
jgi:hypothetical protein